jgi:hypothetical protein
MDDLASQHAPGDGTRLLFIALAIATVILPYAVFTVRSNSSFFTGASLYL